MHAEATDRQTGAVIDVMIDEEDEEYLVPVFWKPARPGDAPVLARPRDSSTSMTTMGWSPGQELVQQWSPPRECPAQYTQEQ